MQKKNVHESSSDSLMRVSSSHTFPPHNKHTSKMAGKIKRQPVIKRGNRGTLGILGKTHRSKSRTPAKRINPHDRNMDYKKREQLNASIAKLEKEELSNWTDAKTPLEVKGKKKELKQLRAKMSLKMNKKN